MINISKFDSVNGVPDEDQIENWVAEFFHSLLNMFNSFFCKLELEDAYARMSIIPFEKLVKEQLEDEKEEVINIAVAKIKQLVETELDFMRSYVNNQAKVD
ncbi:MAG: hypothetical protein PHC92_07300 [Syntrophomonadaceae bacterium]|nr:hypothetical protein [Syntrophomonadaceae bacterium]